MEYLVHVSGCELIVGTTHVQKLRLQCSIYLQHLNSTGIILVSPPYKAHFDLPAAIVFAWERSIAGEGDLPDSFISNSRIRMWFSMKILDRIPNLDQHGNYFCIENIEINRWERILTVRTDLPIYWSFDCITMWFTKIGKSVVDDDIPLVPLPILLSIPVALTLNLIRF